MHPISRIISLVVIWALPYSLRGYWGTIELNPQIRSYHSFGIRSVAEYRWSVTFSDKPGLVFKIQSENPELLLCQILRFTFLPTLGVDASDNKDNILNYNLGLERLQKSWYYSIPFVFLGLCSTFGGKVTRSSLQNQTIVSPVIMPPYKTTYLPGIKCLFCLSWICKKIFLRC